MNLSKYLISKVVLKYDQSPSKDVVRKIDREFEINPGDLNTFYKALATDICLKLSDHDKYNHDDIAKVVVEAGNFFCCLVLNQSMLIKEEFRDDFNQTAVDMIKSILKDTMTQVKHMKW